MHERAPSSLSPRVLDGERLHQEHAANSDHVRSTVRAFFEELDGLLRRVDQAVIDRDRVAVLEGSMRLASALRAVAAPAACERALALVALAREDRLGDAPPALLHLQLEITRLVPYLRGFALVR